MNEAELTAGYVVISAIVALIGMAFQFYLIRYVTEGIKREVGKQMVSLAFMLKDDRSERK